MGTFNIALSALQAYSTAINAVGNNLANMSSTGFKNADINFQDLMSTVTNPSTQVGNGVQQPTTNANFSQGTLLSTGNPLDAAVQGNGFFLLTPAGATGAASPSSYEYTRDGSFQVGPDGTLQAENGSHVQGWSVNPATGTVDSSGTIGNIPIPTGSTFPPVATSTLSVAANLNAAGATGTTLTVPVTVFDSLGGSHQLSLTLTKDASPNTWDMTLTSTDPAIQNGFDLTSLLSTKTLTFTNGALDQATPTAINITALTYTAASGIPAQPTIVWSPWTTPPSGSPAAGGLSGLTQFSQASAVSNVQQNGLAPGTLSGVEIVNGGAIMATFTNGSQMKVGQLAVAGVENPDSLINIGNNAFRIGATTVALPPSVPQTGGTGQVVGGSLESSNVDIATEFTSLITFQSGYQAASRVITTEDQLIQQLMSIIQT
jgi:flagellar hook protein FlgE